MADVIQSLSASLNSTVITNIVTNVTQVNTVMNNLTQTINNQHTQLTRLNTASFDFNKLFRSAKTILSEVAGALNGCENAYKVQHDAEVRLAAAMRQRMGATDAQIESIRRLASAQQQMGVIGDEVQLSGARQLTTYLSQTASIETLLPAMNNLLAQQHGLNASSGDAVTAGSLLGQAMQGQTAGLTRLGVTFTGAEEHLMRYGSESERAAALAGAVARSTGEMNAVLAATPEGQLQQQANAMNGLQESVGSVYVQIKTALLPVFSVVTEKLSALAGWFQQHMDGITAVCSVAADVLGRVFSTVWTVLGGIVDALGWLWGVVSDGMPVLAGVAVTVVGWAAAANLGAIGTWALGAAAQALALKQTVVMGLTKAWTAVQWLLNGAMSANPIGIVIALIAGLVTSVAVCWNKFAGFRAFLITMWDTIKQFGGIIKDFIVDRIVGIIQGVGSLGTAIGKLFKGDFSGAWDAAKEGVKGIVGVDAVKKAAGSAAGVVGGVKDKYKTNLESERAKDAAKKAAADAEPSADSGLPAGMADAAAGMNGLNGLNGAGSPIGGAVAGIGSQAAADHGGSIRNINVTIDKLVEQFTVSTTNLREDAGRVKDLVAEALVGAVNDLNYAL